MDDDLVNVCFDHFLSDREINCVTIDGKGFENLLSLDRKEKSKGFQVETFVRPPVRFSLTFKIPVYVTHILVKPYSDGANQTCKIQLAMNDSAMRKNSCGSFVLPSNPLPVVLYNSQSSKGSNHFELPTKVVGSLVHAKLLGQKIVSQPFKVGSATSTLTMNILWWSGPKSIAIQCLEVWGTVGANVSYEKKRIFKELIQAVSSRDFFDCTEPFLAQKMYNAVGGEPDLKETTSNPQLVSDNDDPTIPCKFLDSLTYNLMTLPVLLPSGHYVDQSTVDKIYELDIMYGRPPSDPFTGIPYSSPPSFCPQLKTEIDRYISDHESLKGTERTVGSSDDILKHRGLS